MSTVHSSLAALDRGLAPVLKLLTPEQLARLSEFRSDGTVVDRIAGLAEKANEGALSEGERSEYDGYLIANKLVSLLQSIARSRLSPSGPTTTKPE